MASGMFGGMPKMPNPNKGTPNIKISGMKSMKTPSIKFPKLQGMKMPGIGSSGFGSRVGGLGSARLPGMSKIGGLGKLPGMGSKGVASPGMRNTALQGILGQITRQKVGQQRASYIPMLRGLKTPGFAGAPKGSRGFGGF